jgi:hypothetical protein
MNDPYFFWFWLGVAGVAIQCAMLGLQLRAYSLYRHFSFGLLAFGSLLGCADLLAAYAPYLQPMSPNARSTLEILQVGLFTTQAVASLWGTVALFKSYGILANAVRAASAQS